jgi:hypothetical protein
MALPPAEQLWFGTGLENIIDFDYPVAFDAPRTWRRPVPGSVRARNSAGVIDAAVYGYDYFLAGRARWFDRGRWGGGTGLQAFLDWAGQGNPFRFVPDKTVPDFYVDNCYLDAPFDEIDPSIEEADGSQAIDIVIRNQTKDFGEALRGIMFDYAPGMSLTDPVAATFSRASAATRRGLPSTSMAAAIGASDLAGVLRDRHYEGSLRTTLLEAARTQLVTDPENFGAWGTAGIVARTGGQADPFGGTAAYLLDSNAPGAGDGVVQAVTFTGNGTKAILCFMRAGTSTQSAFLVYDSSAVVERHRADVNWSGGVPTLVTGIGAGTLFAVVPMGGGWYALALSANGVIAANTNQFYIQADRTGAGGTVYIFGANAWNAAFPSSYQGPSLGTRSADALSWAHGHKPQAMFMLVDFVERGTVLLSANNPRLVQVSNTVGPLFNISTSANKYRAEFYDGVTFSATSGNPTAPVIGDRVVALATLTGAGVAGFRQTINSGAEVAATPAGALSIGAAWGASTLELNDDSTATQRGFNAFARVKVGPLVFGGITRDTIAKALLA